MGDYVMDVACLIFCRVVRGRNTITEISNINSKKGNIRFIDRGNTIIIAYTDRCIYYRIVKINAAELVLMSKSDNTQKLYLASNN